MSDLKFALVIGASLSAIPVCAQADDPETCPEGTFLTPVTLNGVSQQLCLTDFQRTLVLTVGPEGRAVLADAVSRSNDINFGGSVAINPTR